MEKILLPVCLFFYIYFLPAWQVAAQITAGNTQEYNSANRYWPLGGGKAINFNLPSRWDTGYKRGPLPTPFLQSTCVMANAFLKVCTDLAVTDRYTGALLFSFDGEKVYNHKQQVMPHGDSMLGCAYPDYNSFIVPFPDDENKYYLIANHYHESEFYYSVIDMRLNNGLGDVMEAQKNVPVFRPV